MRIPPKATEKGCATGAAQLAKLVQIARVAALDAPRLDTAIGAGRVLGRLLWENPIGPIADEPLEAALHIRHGRSLAKAADAVPAHVPPTDWLHVISEAHDLGGHSALLESILALQAPRYRTAVTVTTSMTPRFADRCVGLGVRLHQLQGGQAERATKLLALGRHAKRIILHIHPDDLGAALAARVLREEGRQVIFLNHADHAFSFGPGAADVVAEVSGYGWRLTRERRVARAQHFLGIPVPPPPPPLSPGQALQAIAEGPILSIGSANKYRPDGARSFPNFLMTLMDKTDRRVELIGPSPKDSWWQQVLDHYGDRLRLHGPLPFEETRARLARAACYVDSFPVTGGTALTQGLMAGKTVFAPPCPAGGYSLADALRAPTITAMTEQILAFLSTGEEPAEQAIIRARIAAEFSLEALARRLDRLKDGAEDPPPAEMLVAAQDLNYYGEAWRRSGGAAFSLPPYSRPALAVRLAVSARLLGAKIHRPKLPKLLWWVLGPPSRQIRFYGKT